MNLRNVKQGDRVEVNVRGREYPAVYVGPADDFLPGWVRVEPLARNINHYHVSPTEIKRKIKGKLA